MTDAFSPSPGRTAQRFLCLWLPRLPTDRIIRQLLGKSWRTAAPREAPNITPNDKPEAPLLPPLAVVAKIRSALRLVALDEQAERLGLARGQPLADARAMIPALTVADDDPAADDAVLEAIADWSERYTPLVAQEARNGKAATGKHQEARRAEGPTGKHQEAGRAGHYGLMLDITGCAHLFGGEAALAADCTDRLEAQGFTVRMAIADTPGAASAAARYTAAARPVVPPGSARALLQPLPLAALRLDSETVSALDRVGLKRIGQIIDAPRGPLAARFGSALTNRLDQALGRQEETISPRRPVPALTVERRFAEPIEREEDITATLASLAMTLKSSLETQGLGARLIELSLFRVDGIVSRLTVGTGRPIRAPKLILDLFREKLAGLGEAIDAGFGFDMVRLAVPEAASTDPAQIDLAGDVTAAADLDGLIDRIGARLGPRHVARMVAHDSHIPERAEIYLSGIEAFEPASPGTLRQAASESGLSGDPIDRPLRLFAKPEPIEAIAEVPDGPPVRFRWRRVLYRIARAEGPERIAQEWWHDDDLTRDYFRVEDAAGRRFWLFREGLYERETTAPRWYLHGVFA